MVKSRELKKNKTLRFLIPVLREYGKEFIYYIDKLNRIAFGINDKAVVYEENTIFILFDTVYNTKLFTEFLDWIRDKSFYIDDYIYGDLEYNLHMVVIKFPDEYVEAYQNFKLGKYSKMYDKNTILKHFKNKDDKNILLKEKGSVFLFLKEIEQEFGKGILTTNEILKDFNKWELSIPQGNDEIFNNE